ncbi:MAG: 4Fe-4S cluster-binding domain-containing protein [Clostridia bacterium]|nr:4Fe-4S cluster-binding domain-containing protein [Clostridia bacterium]MBP3359884.1 4Fe-4S cluster-binding domain-containing protein [Clostridia bacterium]
MRKNLDKFMNKPDTKIVNLTLTNKCNLSCTYCYEHNKEAQSMTFETAKKIIDREMSANDGSNFMCLYYFGGEPYLEFELIKKIHAYMQSRQWEKGWFGFSTTNGTLVHGEIQEWLKENSSSMEVYLSLDGDREMQNINRSNSYDMIDLEFFKKEFPFAKMTVSKETLPKLAKGAIELHEKGFQVSANLGYGVKWSDESLEVLAQQLKILMDYYLAHPEIKVANILDLAIMDMQPGAAVPKRFCGVGPMMKSYDIDGEVYPCHAFAPLCIGKELAEKAKKIDFSCPVDPRNLDEKCRNCPVVGVCPTCYGINMGMSGNIYHICDDHCKMMKIQFLANAMFKYRQYEMGLLELNEQEECRLLQNIKAVQNLAL